MSGSDAKAKRDVLSINITDDLRRSAASCRFLDEYRTTSDRSAKRAKITSALTAGQIMQECELTAVIGFIDTETFSKLSVEQKRLMLLARMQEFIGVTEPVAAPVISKTEAVPAKMAETIPVATPPAAATQVEEKKGKAEPDTSARLGRFAKNLGA